MNKKAIGLRLILKYWMMVLVIKKTKGTKKYVIK